MKKLLFIAICICFAFISCTEKDLYKPGDREDGSSTNFSFQSTIEKSIAIYARNSMGNNTPNVPVSIYVENPYDEDGIRKDNISRIAYGVTDSNGILNIELSKIPNSCPVLYILTDWAGFGGMQIYDIQAGGNVILEGVRYETTRSAFKAQDKETAYDSECISKTTNLYSYLKTNNKGIPTYENEDLVSDVVLPNEFLKLISKWYPESKNVRDDAYLKNPQYCTDMEIKDEYGCEIWATYIGDGGFSNANTNIRNMLCYYQYEGNHSILKEGIDSRRVHKTLIFNNTNQREMPCGRKIQLLYWNGTEYVKIFPKGTRIGWALIQEGLTNAGKYNQTKTENADMYRFSTLELSTVGNPRTTQGIARWCEPYNCNIIGMENREIGHRSYDGDYNDILFCVESTPVQIKPDVEIPVENESTSAEELRETEIFGTLAFEDMFPCKGDWDHNDFVADYTYTKEQNATTGKVSAIILDFTIKAIGGNRENGFGMELPITGSNIARVIGGSLESTNNTDLTTIRIKDRTRELFNYKTGIINTHPLIEQVKGNGSISVRVELKQPVNDADVSFKKFNPFIFVDSRENEIHLPDYKPTVYGKVSFGTIDDATDGINHFYKTNEGHAWALDIPRENAEATGWVHPTETTSVNEAYPEYDKWVSSGGNENKTWYNNPVASKVYNK